MQGLPLAAGGSALRVAARHVQHEEVAMEYNDKVRWLRRYLEAQRRERVLAEEAEQLQAEVERVMPLIGEPEKTIVLERVHTAQKALSDEIFRGLAVRSK